MATKRRKKTLYLNTELTDKIDALLERIPASPKPSLSSMVDQQLPLIVDILEQTVEAIEKRDLSQLTMFFADWKAETDVQVSELYREMRTTQKRIEHEKQDVSTTKGDQKEE